jgi:hypothetical protein
LARGDPALAAEVASVEPVAAQTATPIREYIKDYGETLVALPDETWSSPVTIWRGDS